MFYIPEIVQVFSENCISPPFFFYSGVYYEDEFRTILNYFNSDCISVCDSHYHAECLDSEYLIRCFFIQILTHGHNSRREMRVFNRKTH